MLNRLESRLEHTYTRALSDLLRLRHVRESNPDAGNKDSEKRTESQERTQTTYHAAIRGANSPISFSDLSFEPTGQGDRIG